MIERTPVLNILTHVILISGLVMILIPIWLAFVAATQTLQAVNSAPVEFLPVSPPLPWCFSIFGGGW